MAWQSTLFLLQHLKFLFNGGLDPESADPAELRKRRTLAGSAIFLSPIAIMLLISNVYYGAEADNPAIIAGLLVISIALYLQAYGDKPRAANWLGLFAYYIVPTTLMTSHGVISTPMLWMLPIPPIATLLLGIRAGAVFAALCVAAFVAYGVLESFGVIVPDVPLREFALEKYGAKSIQIYVFQASLVLGILTLSTVVFRYFQSIAENKLTETVSSLQREIKVRVRAEQAARDSEDSKLAFLAAMGHELRTPLNGVIGASKLLKSADSDEERQEFTDVILQSSETLLELINNVLDLSSLESGKVVLEQKSFNIHEFLEQTISPFRFQAASKGLQFTAEISADCPQRIVGDSTRLRQVLINLIGNAIKFTKSGSISVKLDVVDGQLRLAIRDTGIGVPEEAQKTLFEPYIQASINTNREYGGSGLGLSIVKKIVMAMGGDITIESSAGCGASFFVTLPLLEDSNPPQEEDKPESAELPQLRTLVVDDNAVNRMVLSRLLEKDHHQVVAVNDGKQALDYVTSNAMDVILMDIQMPEMDGLTATQMIRASTGPCKDTPIIAITANFNAEDMASAEAAGMDGFVSKPFRYEELLGVLKRTLDAQP